MQSKFFKKYFGLLFSNRGRAAAAAAEAKKRNFQRAEKIAQLSFQRFNVRTA